MRKFVINVNGNQYEVEVEEVGGTEATVQPAVSAAPATTVKAADPEPKPVAPKPAASAGAVKVAAPMPGTILDIKVNTGDAVRKGDVLAILEAMKMENEIVSPQDGSIASVNVTKGASVNSGDLIVSING